MPVVSVHVEISAAGMTLTGTIVVIIATAEFESLRMTTRASAFDDELGD